MPDSSETWVLADHVMIHNDRLKELLRAERQIHVDHDRAKQEGLYIAECTNCRQPFQNIRGGTYCLRCLRERIGEVEEEMGRLREMLTMIQGESYLAMLAPDPHDSALGDPAKSIEEINRLARVALGESS